MSAPLFDGPIFGYRGRLFIQAKLNQYASFLLTNHWRELEESASLELPDGLERAIAVGCFPPPEIRKLRQLPDPVAQNMVVHLFYHVALWMAQDLQRRLRQMNGFDLDGMEYVVVQYEYMHKRGITATTVDGYYRAGQQSGPYHCFIVPPYLRGPQVKMFADESELDVAYRRLVGLLPPKGRG